MTGSSLPYLDLTRRQVMGSMPKVNPHPIGLGFLMLVHHDVVVAVDYIEEIDRWRTYFINKHELVLWLLEHC